MSVQIQKSNVPLATVKMPDGSQIPAYITEEHRRPLDEIAKLLNTLQQTVADQEARLKAAHL